MADSIEAQPSRGGASLVRVCIGLGIWCVGVTVFAAAVWVRTYTALCVHEQIYHHDTFSDCRSLLTSGGVLRNGSAFFELLLLIVVVALPLTIIAPVVLRSLRSRS